MKNRLLFLSLVFLFSTVGYSQIITFDKSIDIISPDQVWQTSDGGYILNSRIFNIVKTNQFGFIEWQKGYDNSLFTSQSGLYTPRAIKTLDGGYAIILNKFDSLSTNICLIKTNENFDTTWTKIYNGNGSTEEGYGLIQLSDGTFIISSYNEFDYSFYLRKTDANGNLIWTKKLFTLVTLTGRASYLVNLENDNFLFGKIGSGGKIIKLNSEADTLWVKNNIATNKSFYTNDQHILISTSTNLQKLDTGGNLIWQVPISNVESFVQTIENNYVLLQRSPQAPFQSNLVEMDLSGNILFDTEMGSGGSTIIKAADGGYTICSNWLSRLVKTDSEFNYTAINLTNPMDVEEINTALFNQYPITWNSKNVNYVNIEYSTDNQNTWNSIIDFYPADADTFIWDIPLFPDVELYLKISDSFNSDIFDRSDPPQNVINFKAYDYIAANEIFMWVGNNGMNSHDPRTDASGFYWPGGENATISAVYSDGLVWGGKVNGEIRVNGATYRYGLTPGYILPSGLPSDPTDVKARIFKLKKDWQMLPIGSERDRYEFNFLNWPVDVGAPWNDNNDDGVYTLGIDEPRIIGDETLFFVANDLDSARSLYTYGSNPIGLEFQVTTFGYNTELLKDVVFKKFRVINKSSTDVTDMYFTYWADDDLGDASDDYVGFDSTLNLAYCYNADNDDNFFYETPPPALAHMIVQGPTVTSTQSDSARFGDGWKKGYKNLNISSSGLNFKGTMIGYPGDPHLGIYEGTLEFYNMMQGLNSDGNPIINPISGEPTIWPLCGDPVAGTGWFEGDGWPGGPAPSDRRYHVPTGFFNLAVGDTQEVAIAFLIKKGTDNINSITELKNYAAQIQHWYDNDFVTDVNENNILLPTEFSLSQNYPNPFNPSTSIQYAISSRQLVQLKVYDILGSEVATLVNQEQSAGNYKVDFNAKHLSSGVYFYQIKAGDFIQTKKMILIK